MRSRHDLCFVTLMVIAAAVVARLTTSPSPHARAIPDASIGTSPTPKVEYEDGPLKLYYVRGEDIKYDALLKRHYADHELRFHLLPSRTGASYEAEMMCKGRQAATRGSLSTREVEEWKRQLREAEIWDLVDGDGGGSGFACEASYEFYLEVGNRRHHAKVWHNKATTYELSPKLERLPGLLGATERRLMVRVRCHCYDNPEVGHR